MITPSPESFISVDRSCDQFATSVPRRACAVGFADLFEPSRLVRSSQFVRQSFQVGGDGRPTIEGERAVKVDRSLPCSDGVVERLEVDRVVSDPVIDRYVTYLTIEDGLTPGTVRLHRHQLSDGLTSIISMVLGVRGPWVRPGSRWIRTPG